MPCLIITFSTGLVKTKVTSTPTRPIENVVRGTTVENEGKTMN